MALFYTWRNNNCGHDVGLESVAGFSSYHREGDHIVQLKRSISYWYLFYSLLGWLERVIRSVFLSGLNSGLFAEPWKYPFYLEWSRSGATSYSIIFHLDFCYTLSLLKVTYFSSESRTSIDHSWNPAPPKSSTSNHQLPSPSKHTSSSLHSIKTDPP